MLQRPTQWTREEITVPNLWFFSFFSHTRRRKKKMRKRRERTWMELCGSHAVRSTWMAGFFFFPKFLKGEYMGGRRRRERKAGNLRNLHAISTQKNKRRLSGIFYFFFLLLLPSFTSFCVCVQLTRRERERVSERQIRRVWKGKKKEKKSPAGYNAVRDTRTRRDGRKKKKRLEKEREIKETDGPSTLSVCRQREIS